MAGADLESDNGFVRQRRNLILVSLAQLAALKYELTIDQVNILGNVAKLSGNFPVANLLWWFCAYFLWRYYTSHSELHGKNTRSKYMQLLSVERSRLLRRYLEAKAMKQYPGATISAPNSSGTRPWNEREVYFSIVTLPHDGNIYGDTKQVNVEHQLTEVEDYRCMAIAGFRLILQTSHFTEYYLPYLIGLAPVAYYWLMK